MITVLWHNGSATTGKDWIDVERALRAAQWSSYPDNAAFRRAMAYRAKVWNGAKINTHGTAQAFMRRLEAAGMCRIEEGSK